MGAQALTIVRELEFDHHRMTSGSVVKNSAGRITVFIKGSYEKAPRAPESLMFGLRGR